MMERRSVKSFSIGCWANEATIPSPLRQLITQGLGPAEAAQTRAANFGRIHSGTRKWLKRKCFYKNLYKIRFVRSVSKSHNNTVCEQFLCHSRYRQTFIYCHIFNYYYYFLNLKLLLLKYYCVAYTVTLFDC